MYVVRREQQPWKRAGDRFSFELNPDRFEVGKVISLSELCSQEGEQVDSGAREMGRWKMKSDPMVGRVLNFPRTVGQGKLWAGREIKVDSYPAFKPTSGLNCLFNAGGCRGV